jgi:hypothetical protein
MGAMWAGRAGELDEGEPNELCGGARRERAWEAKLQASGSLVGPRDTG